MIQYDCSAANKSISDMSNNYENEIHHGSAGSLGRLLF